MIKADIPIRISSARHLVGVVLLSGLIVAAISPHQPACIDVRAVEATTYTACLMLHALRIDVDQDGNVVRHPNGFEARITNRCAGSQFVTFFFLVVVLSSNHWMSKWVSLFATIILVFLVNTVRLTHLFIIGSIDFQNFTLFHDYIWKLVMLFVIINATIFCSLSDQIFPFNRKKLSISPRKSLTIEDLDKQER